MAVQAKEHGIPFYVAAPSSTLDPATPDGSTIPIEQRPADEVRKVQKCAVTPEEVKIWNPAFDVTPARLVTGVITEQGITRNLGDTKKPFFFHKDSCKSEKRE